MPVLAWLLWTLLGGTLGGPTQLATWPDLGVNPVKTTEYGAPRPSFYHLPMYQHAPRPLVAQELFQPVLHISPLPAGLTALLFPSTLREPQHVPGTGVRPVDVWCGMGRIYVRVDRLQLRAWPVPSLFRLGSCEVNKISPRFLHFDYKLTECDGESKVVGGQLVYTYLLCYTPPLQGLVIRVVPLYLPIHCHYNRFHYSYQVGYRPQVQQTTFMKSIRSKLRYSLTVCNAQGQPVLPGHWFYLGEPVYFVAQARVLLAGETLYVDSCYATSSKDPNSMPRVDIITNYGCMTDSRRGGSSSRFLMRGGSVLVFSVDAVLFKPVSQVLYLHCSMSVGLTTSHASKSCSYNTAAGRWEELQASASVCSCCDSMCTDMQSTGKNTVSSPGWMIKQRVEEKQRKEETFFQAEEGIEGMDEEKRDEKMDQRHKVQTFPWEMEISREEENEKAILEKTAEKKEWRHSAAVSQQGEDETEEVVVGKNLARDMIMSETRPEEAREEVSGTKNGFVSGLPHDSGGTNASRDLSGSTTTARNSNFGIDYNPNNPGSADNASTAIIPFSKLCPGGDQMSCNATINTIDVYTGIGAESFTPSNAASSTSSLGDSSSILETLAGTRNFEIDPAGFLDISKSEKGRLESEMLDTLLSSEQFESVSESVDTESDEIQGRAGDYVNSKGPHGGGDVLHSPKIRLLESDQSAPPAGFKDQIFAAGLLGESDFDSGVKEGEALHPSQFTEAVKTQGQREVWETFTRPHSSGSVDSEMKYRDSPGHSAVVAVTNALLGSASSQMFDGEWAEVVSGRG